MTRFCPALVLLVLLALWGAAAPAQAEPPLRGGRHDPSLERATVQQAIATGVDFLVRTQQPDGSWGTPAPALYLDIYSPVPGAQHAYHVASSALSLSALVEVGGERAGVAEAIRKGADWLLEHHGVKRVIPRVLYNNWAHAYALEAFSRLHAREQDEDRRARYRAGAREAIALLERFQYVDGGWGYYDFGVMAKTPGHGQANSFTTAAVLVALRLAADQGIEVPERLTGPGARLIRMSRLPGGAYSYGFNFNFRAPWGVNKPQGSLARTPACQAALLAWDDPVPRSRVVSALDRLEDMGHFLLIARKYPRPHESWYQNSGYFCFYGYYYASRLLEAVGSEKRAFHRRRIAAHLVPLQEPGGAWWDYQLYRHHKIYGTGYVLMALANCMNAANPDAATPDEAILTPEPSTD